MDDIVKQALAKWPNVPHCYGWLGLDARGNWYMRDDRTQAEGPFVQAKGSMLRHDKLIDFIHRNYEHDDDGQWFFQNGPQRVYVELEAAPMVWRVADEGGGKFTVTAHTGQAVDVSGCLLDEAGRLYLVAPIGLGLVHTQDVGIAADAIEQGLWTPEPVQASELPQRFGHVMSPAERHAGVAAALSKQ
ncbi:hypothetical protein RT97_04470 [Variovorax paradoxus]|uniref:DUF2946 family protein n=1 Tax=Variovorax paradoxus TaxID=34073 RepID=A0A0D0N2J0_VARPD|nr:DUF2946 family protein [Variovorax paradoxus]KIQ35575.1 hypothetical protein RT97_04470 [Variovorax paradoxus]